MTSRTLVNADRITTRPAFDPTPDAPLSAHGWHVDRGGVVSIRTAPTNSAQRRHPEPKGKTMTYRIDDFAPENPRETHGIYADGSDFAIHTGTLAWCEAKLAEMEAADPEPPTTTVMQAADSLVAQADAMAKVAEVLALDTAIEYEQALDAQARGRV